MSTTKNNDIEKVLRDRKNHLKSDLRNLKGFKLTKVKNEDKIREVEIKIGEIEWLEKKLKIS